MRIPAGIIRFGIRRHGWLLGKTMTERGYLMGKDSALFTINLRLFDGGGAGGSGGAGGAGAGSGTGAAQTGEAGTTPSAAGKGSRAGGPRVNSSRANSLTGVRYGRQSDTASAGSASATAGAAASGGESAASADTAGEEGKAQAAAESSTAQSGGTDAPEARRSEFERLIQGDYKDLFSERVQAIIDRRFRETKNLQAQAERSKPILDMLSAKYGVTDGDMDKLAKAIDGDDSYYAEEAARKGLTVAQLKEIRTMERENAQLKAAKQEAERRQEADKVYSDWISQADQLKTVYPAFDLNAEVKNPDFMKMLRSGVSVKAAYQAAHMDDIMGGAMQYTARKIQEQTVNSIRTRAGRPAENGLASQPGVVVKNDVSRLTSNDRREIARRAARGEQIQF